MVLAAGFVVLVGALYLLGTWGDEGERAGADGARRGPATPTPTAKPAEAAGGARPRQRAVRLRIVASDPVSVCLEAADGAR